MTRHVTWTDAIEAGRRLLDLGEGDVHVDGAGTYGPPLRTPRPTSLRDAAAVLVRRGGRVLAVSRAGDEHDLGLPAGMVEDGETPAQAAARELAEETGVHVAPETLRHVGTFPTTGEAENLHVFEATTAAGGRLRPEPGEIVAWTSPAELQAARTFGAFMRRHAAALFPRGPRTMAEITTKKRKALPSDAFGDPEGRAYPIHDAAHVRNAAARLEQQKASLSPEKYREIRGRIARAARRFGISSEYNRRKGGGSVHVRADLAHGGKLTVVHHMSDRIGVELRLGEWIDAPEGVTLRSADPDTKLVWIQLAEVGTFRGHPAGPFRLDAAVFSDIVRNFERDGLPVPIDYEHASEQDPTSGNIPIAGAPATGWIHKIENRGDAGLWGLVEWSGLARDQIKSGAYRFLSPAVRFGAKDRVTGEQIGAKLTSAALTNQPFLKGMKPLAARDSAGGEDVALGGSLCYSAADYLPKIKAALRLPELATAPEVSDAMSRLRAHFDDADGDATAMSNGIRLADFLHPLRDLVAGGRLSATWEEVFETVEAMIAAAMGKHIVEDHGGVDDEEVEEAEMKALAATATLEDGGDTAEETNMSEKTKENAVASAPAQDIATEFAKATVQLTEARGKLAEQESELVKLRADAAKREEEDLSREADAIIASHPHLSDAMKPHLVTLLKADPVATRAMYPAAVDTTRAALQRQVVGAPASMLASETAKTQGGPTAAPHVEYEFPDGSVLDSRVFDETCVQTTSRLMRERSISYEQASNEAFKQHQRAASARH